MCRSAAGTKQYVRKVLTLADARKSPDEDVLDGDVGFKAIIAARVNEMRQASMLFAEQHLTIIGYGETLSGIVVSGHYKASELGRRLSGSENETWDTYWANIASDDEVYYINRWMEQLEAKDPRYWDAERGVWRDDALTARATMYTGRMRGTANRAFMHGSEDKFQFKWQLGAGVLDHCTECPQFSAMGWLEKDDFPTLPGENDTPCLFNCECTLVRSDNISGVSPV